MVWYTVYIPRIARRAHKLRFWTAGAWLLKLEAIRREGERNLLGVQAPYAAAVAGGEYAFYSVFGSSIDVSLIGEWNYDARDAHALPRCQPMTLQDDLFVAVRLGFNDVQSTELTVSVLGDRDRNTRVFGTQSPGGFPTAGRCRPRRSNSSKSIDWICTTRYARTASSRPIWCTSSDPPRASADTDHRKTVAARGRPVHARGFFPGRVRPG